jgi:hypothetical protein
MMPNLPEISPRRRFAAALGFVAAAIVLFGPADAQAQSQNKPAKRAPKVIQLEEIKIEGRVQKPNAFYILNRSNLGYQVLDLRTSFLRDIVRAVQSEPF